MTTKHTPGPWTCGLRPMQDGVFIVEALGEQVDTLVATAHSNIRTNQEATANARLIAAAPDLLAALIRVLEYNRDLRNWDSEEKDAARAAIKRALEG
jgi:hypothetical protein